MTKAALPAKAALPQNPLFLAQIEQRIIRHAGVARDLTDSYLSNQFVLYDRRSYSGSDLWASHTYVKGN